MLYTWRFLEFGNIKWSWIWLTVLHTQAAHDGHHLKVVELWRSLCLCPAGLPGPHHRDHPCALLHGPSVGEEASGHAGGQRRHRKVCSGGRQTGFFRPGEIRRQKRTLQLLHHVSHATGCVCVFSETWCLCFLPLDPERRSATSSPFDSDRFLWSKANTHATFLPASAVFVLLSFAVFAICWFDIYDSAACLAMCPFTHSDALQS